MKYTIGRNAHTRQLSIIKDGVSKNFGQDNSVPMDVSRHHMSLEQEDNGKWTLRNLKEDNVTFVNGIAVESKTVSENDRIELGNSRYLFSWASLQEPKVETIDIRHLHKVWGEYNASNIRIKKHQKDIGILASVPMGVSMLGGFLSGFAPDELKPYAYIFTGIALLIMFYGFYKRFTDESIDEQEEIKKKFQRTFVCPKCGLFMGFQDYEVLKQKGACPHCKTKFKK